MKGRLHQSALPSPEAALTEYESIAVPLSQHAGGHRIHVKRFGLGDQNFTDGIGVQEQIVRVGAKPQTDDVAVLLKQLFVTAQ